MCLQVFCQQFGKTVAWTESQVGGVSRHCFSDVAHCLPAGTVSEDRSALIFICAPLPAFEIFSLAFLLGNAP